MRGLLLAFWLVCLALLGVAEARQQPQPASAGATIAWVELADLPGEARTTLQLIERKGPFPYPRDGIVFGNYERRLPPRARGYYHEYTVPTPGSRNRGARRIISGEPGEYYYTADHYRSFRRIRE